MKIKKSKKKGKPQANPPKHCEEKANPAPATKPEKENPPPAAASGPEKNKKTFDETENPAPASSRTYRYDVPFYDRTIMTLVTNSSDFVEWWIQSLVGIDGGQGLVFGLGVFVDPPDGDTRLQSVAALQLCIDNTCLIYHSFKKDSYPNSLKNLLIRQDITFVGFKQGPQLNILKRDAGLGFTHEMPYQDLHYLAARSYSQSAFPDEDCLASLVTDVIRKIDLVRPQPDGRWDSGELSDQQVEYLTIGVYMSLLMARLLLTASKEKPQRVIIRENRVERSIQKLYEVEIFDRTILTTVTKRLVVVEMWMDENMNNGLVEYRYVGFDAELVTVDNKPRIGTVQFCVESRCLIIQLDQMHPRYLPRLANFLLEDQNIFVGVDIERKMELLKDMLLFVNGGPVKFIDLESLGASIVGNSGLDTLAEHCIGIQVEQPDVVGADWDGRLLSVEQVKRALVDAALPYEIVKRIRVSTSS